MKKISLVLVLLTIFVFSVIPFSSSYADIGHDGDEVEGHSHVSQGNNPPRVVKLSNPLGEGVTSPTQVAGQAINSILGIVGSLALLMFIFGGLTWMTSAGNEEKVKKGRGIIVWAVLGLFIIFTSYALVNFVIKDLIGA